MAQTARQTFQPEVPARIRRDDLIRPPELRRDFPVREAQRYLRDKERPWAPLAYAVFLAACVLIFCSAYVTYAFSKYRNVILPGVRVDTVNVGGMSEKQATLAIYAQLGAIYHKPVSITYGAWPAWQPKDTDIGLTYQVNQTIRQAEAVGRNGGFLSELIDRLPFHPVHVVPVQYSVDPKRLQRYLQTAIAGHVFKQESDADLQTRNGHVVLIPSQRGLKVDIPASVAAIETALGHLNRQSVTLRVDHIEPVITDQAAIGVRDRVERFLAAPPIIRLGRIRVVTGRTDFAPMLSFQQQIGKNRATIKMIVSSAKLQAFISRLASTVDRPAANPKVSFSAGQVQVISPRRTGRTLDQSAAYSQLAAVIVALKPNAHLRFQVAITQPTVDPSNPASLGINTLVGSASTTFTGAPSIRLEGITQIAKTLDGDLLPPGQDVSFNTLAGTSWDPRVYQDDETQANGQVVPSAGGAMQQVATTFLRALYGAGLQLKEVHSHTHRLRWYEPPVGLDAVVAPDRGWDLVFTNNTGKYLLLKTRVEPVRQQVYIYVYGPKLGWSVAVDKLGKITKIYPHGPKIIRQDPSLIPGQIRQIQFAHNGADVVVQRTITYPNGKVTTDEIHTSYRPWKAIILVGSQQPTATPTATAGTRTTPTPAPSPTSAH